MCGRCAGPRVGRWELRPLTRWIDPLRASGSSAASFFLQFFPDSEENPLSGGRY
jgi:hypothetical protein